MKFLIYKNNFFIYFKISKRKKELINLKPINKKIYQYSLLEFITPK